MNAKFRFRIRGLLSYYGKEDCEQKALQVDQLRKAGYLVNFVDLFERELEPEELSPYFENRPIRECIDWNAPQLVSEELSLHSRTDTELLQAIAANPALIKRPLISYNGRLACGFDHPLVQELLEGRASSGHGRSDGLDRVA